MQEPHAEWSMQQTVQRAACGDAEAWTMLVRSYTGRVYGLLVRQCGDGELAEELTQATFAKLAGQLGREHGYEERGRFEAWLFRVAMNLLRDEMRRRKRQAVSLETQTVEAIQQANGPRNRDNDRTQADPLAAVTREEQLELVRAAVAELGEADREILYLRHTAGLSFPQIAETLDQPLGTVLARGHRALAKLRKRLSGQQVDLDQ